jgi:hypothetical protein
LFLPPLFRLFYTGFVAAVIICRAAGGHDSAVTGL